MMTTTTLRYPDPVLANDAGLLATAIIATALAQAAAGLADWDNAALAAWLAAADSVSDKWGENMGAANDARGRVLRTENERLHTLMADHVALTIAMRFLTGGYMGGFLRSNVTPNDDAVHVAGVLADIVECHPIEDVAGRPNEDACYILRAWAQSKRQSPRPADVEAAVTALSSAPAVVTAAKILEQRTTNTCDACDACGDSTANAVYCDDCLAEQTAHALNMLYEDSLDFELDDDGEDD